VRSAQKSNAAAHDCTLEICCSGDAPPCHCVVLPGTSMHHKSMQRLLPPTHWHRRCATMCTTRPDELRWGLFLPSRQLEEAYWLSHHAHYVLQDTVFFAVFLVMHICQLSIIPAHTQPLYSVGAIVFPLGVLLIQWCAPSFYRRHRELVVFATHLTLTHIRAAVVNTMRAQAAVGWKGGGSVGTGESPMHLFLRWGRAHAGCAVLASAWGRRVGFCGAEAAGAVGACVLCAVGTLRLHPASPFAHQPPSLTSTPTRTSAPQADDGVWRAVQDAGNGACCFCGDGWWRGGGGLERWECRLSVRASQPISLSHHLSKTVCANPPLHHLNTAWSPAACNASSDDCPGELGSAVQAAVCVHWLSAFLSPYPPHP